MKPGEMISEVREAVEGGDNVKREVDGADTALSRSTLPNPRQYGSTAQV